MKYICTFHTDKMEIIEVFETNIKPEYVKGDFITITSNELYRVMNVIFNHDLFNERIFVYVQVNDLNDDENNFIESLVNSNKG